MIKYEDECVGCTGIGLPCIGSSCPNREVPHYYCDKCGDEVDPEDLYDVDGVMMCAECILSQYNTIE